MGMNISRFFTMSGSRRAMDKAAGVGLSRFPSRRRLGAAAVVSVCLVLGLAGRAKALEGLAYDFLPSKGQVRILVILARTPDAPPDFSPEDMKRIFFSREDDGYSSVAEYYSSVSYGRFQICGEVTEWVDLPRSTSDYSGGRFGQSYGSWPDNLGRLVHDAVLAGDESGVDFSLYDNSGDGHVDGLVVVHSGADAAGDRDRMKIWSRADYLSMYGGDPLELDGVKVDRFSLCPEYFHVGERDTIFPYAHEMGHLLGLPDLYDTDKGSLGIGAYGLMSHPPLVHGHGACLAPTAYSRMALGWIEPRRITENQPLRLGPIASSPEAAVIGTPFPGQYFILSCHQPIKEDAFIFGDGMLVWRVNENAVYGNRLECRKGGCEGGPLLSLIQADGNNDLEMGKAVSDPSDFFPGPAGVTQIGPDTGRPDNPLMGANTLAVNGYPTGVRIKDLKADKDGVEVSVIIDDEGGPCSAGSCLRVTRAVWDDGAGNGNGWAEPDEKVELRLFVFNAGPKIEKADVSVSGPLLKWKRDSVKIKDLAAGGEGEVSFSAKVPEEAASGLPAWLDYKLTVKDSGVTRQTAPDTRTVVGVPSLLIVDDAPRDLIPYCRGAADRLKVPYSVVDVERHGLPSLDMAASCPEVLWLSGTRALSSTYPDGARRKIFDSIIDRGGALAWSVARMDKTAGPDVLGPFAASPEPMPGIGAAKGLAPGGKTLNFVMGVPYYPSLVPHLVFDPGEGISSFLTDQKGRPTAVLKFPDSDPQKGGDPKRLSMLLGFPFEALNPRDGAMLLEVAMGLPGG